MKKNRINSIIKKIFSFFSQGILIAIVAITVLAAVTILLYWQTNVVANGVKKYLNYSLNDSTRLNYGTIEGSLLNNIKIDSLSFVLDKKMKISGRQIVLKYDLWPLIDDQIKISTVHLDSLNISIIPQTSKKTNRKKRFQPGFITCQYSKFTFY